MTTILHTVAISGGVILAAAIAYMGCSDIPEVN